MDLRNQDLGSLYIWHVGMCIYWGGKGSLIVKGLRITILVQSPLTVSVTVEQTEVERSESVCSSWIDEHPGFPLGHNWNDLKGLRVKFSLLVIISLACPPFSPLPHSPFIGSVSGVFACVHWLLPFPSSVGRAMTAVAVPVDSKAELTTLLEQWEKDHGSGQDMVPILTR